MASRFWVPVTVSGAANNGSGLIRLTVNSTSGIATNDSMTVVGVVGTTEANATWAVTVIDATHLDLQGSTFTNAYVSGGNVHGEWKTGNTANWAASSGGAGNQTVPGSSDSVTLDANAGTSGTPNIIVNGTVSVSSIISSAFTGTLDVSVNNNNVTTGGYTNTGTGGTQTLKMGSGTWTLTGTSSTIWDASNSNLTLAANTATIVFQPASAASNARAINLGAKTTYNTVRISATNTNGQANLIRGGGTIATLNADAGAIFTVTSTITISNAFNWAGTSTSPILVYGEAGSTATVSAASGSTLSWGALMHVTFSNTAVTATNSFDLGANNMNGGSISAPSTVSGAGVIGG